MTESNAGSEPSKVTIPTIEKLLSFIQDKDARLGLVLSVFLLLLSTFVWFSGAYGSILGGGFFNLLRAFGVFLLLAVGVVIFFKAIDGSILPRIIVWYFISLLLITISAFWVQAILRTPTSILIDARCFVDLWQQGCPLGTEVAKEVVTAPVPENQDTHGSTPASSYHPDKRNRVFVQFSGDLSRENVTKVSLTLKSMEWNVNGAEQGGERTAQAAGIDQVRYFLREDKDLATKLATQYNELASWRGFDQLSVAFVAGYTSRIPIGHLEVWTSVD